MGTQRAAIAKRGAAIATLALAISLCFGAQSASAAHKAPIFDFGASGTQGGQLNGARGIAINETGSGGVPQNTIYVVDFSNNRIQSFDANGNFIRAWGWDVIQAGKPGDSGAEFEICTLASDCKGGTAGGGAGQFNGIAGGIAIDQSTGNVYVVDRGNFRIQQFTAGGAFVRAWGSSGSGAGQFSFDNAIAGIGVDGAGNVYVADNVNKRVQKFDSEGNFLAMGGWDVDSVAPSTEYEVCTVAANCKAGVGGTGVGQFAGETLCCPNYLAVSPAGDVFTVGRADGTIYRLTPALAFDPTFAPPAVPSGAANRNALTVNRADGHLFFTKPAESIIYELDPATQTVVHEHPADAAYTPAADGKEWVGLAVNSLTGRIYGTRTTSASFVRVIDEAVAIPVAMIEAPELTSWTRATLKGTVDPEGAELTECRFEYGPTTAYGNTVPCAESPAAIGTGTSPVAVHADISALQANGAKYNVRLVAANSKAQAQSANQPFETPEVAISEPASEIKDSEATLNGQLNPFGQAMTECSFEYGPTTAYGNTIPCAESPGEIGTGTSPVAVHADISGLDPGAIYHFRLKAANALDGQATGKDLSFQTLGPVIADTWSEDVSFSEATLWAQIDPEGKATTFRFQYGTQGPCSANPCTSVPIPDGAVGSDSAVHEVSRLISGLQPDTTYHYRVIASNSDAVNQGPDRSFTTFALFALDTDCPNQAFRFGPSANLPDCRAYEMVTPLDKNGGDIVAGGGNEFNIEAAFRQASSDGERVTYTSKTAFADPPSSRAFNQYLSSRDPEAGWLTDGLNPPLGEKSKDGGGQTILGINFRAFSEDICRALVRDDNLVPLTPDALAGRVNLYVRDNCGPGAATYEALTRELAFPMPADHEMHLDYGSFTREGDHVVFGAAAPLATDVGPQPDPGTHAQIYDYDLATGQLRLASVLPGGAAATVGAGVAGPFTGVGHSRFSPLERAVSADGSRIVWTVADVLGGDGQIYVRLGGTQTVQATEGFNAVFITAAADGSALIYSQGGSLHEFDVDLAVEEEAGGASGAEARQAATSEIAGKAGGVVGASRDLSRLYFTSKEVLDTDPNSEGDTAIEGEYNVYLREGGEETFVARVAPLDADDPLGFKINSSLRSPFLDASKVTPDGRHLTFMSIRPLTGYDSTDAASGETLSEIFRYDAETGELVCASCRPSGARPEGRKLEQIYNADLGGVPQVWAAAWLPTWEWGTNEKRALSEDGNRVLFNSYDDILPTDVNGVQDVYQWEAPGSGGCDQSDPDYFAKNGGCLALISTGRSHEDSELLDASADGSDVFFTTGSSIHTQDVGNIDVYDARVGGGFPPPPPPLPPCVGDACQSVPAPPDDQTPTSASFRGPGDPKPQPNCSSAAGRAAGLARKAKQLREESKKADANRAKQLRERAAQLAKQAKRVSASTKRCRRTNRRAGR